MKNLKLLFTALLLLCCVGMATAHDFEVDGIYYDVTNDINKTVEVTYKGTYYYSYDEYTDCVVIPESVTYDGSTYSVTSIGRKAFYYCKGLTSITIPNSVTSIGEDAFRDCTGLTSIVVAEGNNAYDSRNNCNAIIETSTNTLIYGCKNTVIPNSVTSIGSDAFNGCSGLTNITIPNSVTSIGEGAFEDCSGLTSIEIPNSVTSIERNAFSYCYGLTSITIPNSVKSIGYGAFEYCTGLTSIKIPNSVTSIGAFAFHGCSGLTSITIPNSVKSIGYRAFEDCTGLTSITVETGNTKYDSRDNCNAIIETATNTLIAGFQNTTIPNSVTSIGEHAFEGCSGLASITIPNSVTRIGELAFDGCTGLTSITIPNSVTRIGNEAFSYCYGLTSITIPNSVTSIGGNAFRYCYRLQSVEFNAKNCTYMGNSSYPVFEDCTSLSTVTIGENVKNIPDYAFCYCTGLTSITIPSSVTSIGEDAFHGCTGLKTVYNFSNLTFSEGLEDYGYVAYYADKVYNAPNGSIEGDFIFGKPNDVNTLVGYLGNATVLTLPADYKGKSVTSIGNYAFYGCTGLTSITIPNSVTSIGDGAFSGCTGLKTVINFSNLTFSTGSSSNGYVAYYADKVYNAPNGSIEGDFIFGKPNDVNTLVGYLGNATVLTLPADYKGENYAIGANVFKGKTTITSVTIPNSVTSIGEDAFNGCSGLTSIVVDGNNTKYDSREDCNAIIETETNTLISGCKNTVIPNSVTSIENYAFDGCYGLTSTTIPNSITSIGDGAFSGCTGLKTVYNFSNLTFSEGSEDYGYVACYADKVYNAPNGFIDGDFIFGKPNDVNTLVGYLGNDAEPTLPANYKGEDYVIGAKAFYGNTVLTSITIPNSVTSIGDYALRGCTGLTSITIPNSVTSIENSAFEGCTSLKELRIEDGEGTLNTGEGLFNDCPLETLYLGRNLSQRSPFYEIKTLASVTIGNSVTSIGDEAFYNCTGLTSVVIGNSVTSFGNSAFNGCTGLTSITIPNSVTSIGNNAFQGCAGLTAVHINDLAAWCGIDFGSADANPLYYAKNLYLNGELLTSLTIPAEVAEVKDYAFYNCNGVTNIEIVDGVKSIGSNAFYGCSKLETLYISKTIESIGNNAFAECNNIFDIKIGSKKVITASENIFSTDVYNNAYLYVPDGRKDFYAKTSPWSNFIIREMDFTGIEDVETEGEKVQTIYDLTGRKLKGENGKRKGIYIIDGKKVLVK